ncbi:MAG: hypothetical protein Q9157_007920 [Trypethelium eluteriae]
MLYNFPSQPEPVTALARGTHSASARGGCDTIGRRRAQTSWNSKALRGVQTIDLTGVDESPGLVLGKGAVNEGSLAIGDTSRPCSDSTITFVGKGNAISADSWFDVPHIDSHLPLPVVGVDPPVSQSVGGISDRKCREDSTSGDSAVQTPCDRTPRDTSTSPSSPRRGNVWQAALDEPMKRRAHSTATREGRGSTKCDAGGLHNSKDFGPTIVVQEQSDHVRDLVPGWRSSSLSTAERGADHAPLSATEVASDGSDVDIRCTNGIDNTAMAQEQPADKSVKPALAWAMDIGSSQHPEATPVRKTEASSCQDLLTRRVNVPTLIANSEAHGKSDYVTRLPKRQRAQYASLLDKPAPSDNHVTRYHNEGVIAPPSADRNRALKQCRCLSATRRDGGSPICGVTGASEDDGLPPVDPDDGQYLVEKLLEMRVRPLGNRKRRRITQYLVKWKGYGDGHNSWINEDDIHDGLVQRFLVERSQLP